MQLVKRNNIGVIGFGAGGLSFFVQLIDQLIEDGSRATIDIFEPSGRLGLGKAYSTTSSNHILNLNTHYMSVVHSKTNHFHEWFQNNESAWRPHFPNISPDDPFPPRGIFGIYLGWVFEEYMALAEAHGIVVRVHKNLVIDISKNDDSEEFIIKDSSGLEVLVDLIVLAIGNMPSESYEQFAGQKGYYLDAELSEDQETEFKTKSIGIIGTRLTAIDVALQLILEKGANNVTLLSRTGKIPKVIGPAADYDLKYLTPTEIQRVMGRNRHLALSDLVELFKKEIDHALGVKEGWKQVISLQPTTLSDLQEEIKLVESGTMRQWQSILIKFYPFVPGVWSLLSSNDRKQFLEKYHSFWLTYLAAFPLKNAKKIEDLWSSSKLDVVGGLVSIDFDAKQSTYTARTSRGEYVFDVLVNATGAGHRPFEQSAIISVMQEKGLLAPGPLGDVNIDLESCRVKGRKGIYALGEITFGDWFATADLSQISRQAERMVADIFS